jgi:hypothetical protein
MRHYFTKILDGDLPHAIMGLNGSIESDGGRWIELIAMVYKNTMDNQDERGSGQVVRTVYSDSCGKTDNRSSYTRTSVFRISW